MSVIDRHLRSNVVAYIALCFALGLGSAWAATELGKNDVKSKHIKNGQVKKKDLAAGSVDSSKVANGALLGEDFAPGQLPEGPQGVPGSARAYGLVSAGGALSRSKNVVGVTKEGVGTYCIQLDASINVSQAVLIAEEEYGGNSTNVDAEMASHVEWLAGGGTCGPSSMLVLTFNNNGDELDDDDGGGNSTGDDLFIADQGFAFMVP